MKWMKWFCLVLSLLLLLGVAVACDEGEAGGGSSSEGSSSTPGSSNPGSSNPGSSEPEGDQSLFPEIGTLLENLEGVGYDVYRADASVREEYAENLRELLSLEGGIDEIIDAEKGENFLYIYIFELESDAKIYYAYIFTALVQNAAEDDNIVLDRDGKTVFRGTKNAIAAAKTGVSNDEPEGSEPGGSEPGAGTKWENVDFSGTALRISISTEQYNHKTNIPSSDRYIRGLDSAASDDVINMVMDRNRDVSDILGIAVYYLEVKHQYADVQGYIDELVMAATFETPDIFIDDVFGSIRSAMNGTLRNVMEQDDGKNYFDFKDDLGWYTEYMDGLTLNPDAKYILAGDYFIDVLRASHVLFVNIDRYEEIIGDIEANLYMDIQNGLWTYDYLAGLANIGWDPGPNNRTGSAQVDDDCIGFLIDSIAVYPFFYGSNDPNHALYQKDAQGQYKVVYDNQTYFTFANDIYNLLTGQAVYQTMEDGQSADKRSSTIFANGNVLIAEGMWLSDLENPEIRNMEDRKGVVVYPKQYVDTPGGYNTYVHDIAEVGSIAASTMKFSACTAYLQCVNEFSGDMIRQYTEYALKFKYNNYATGAMIDIIYNSIGSPFEGIMGKLAFDQVNTGSDIKAPKDSLVSCVRRKTFDFVNNYQQSYNVYVAGINTLLTKFGAQ